MGAQKKEGKVRKPARHKPGALDSQDNSSWPMLERDVMDELARNIEKNRNKPGSIPYPFNRE